MKPCTFHDKMIMDISKNMLMKDLSPKPINKKSSMFIAAATLSWISLGASLTMSILVASSIRSRQGYWFKNSNGIQGIKLAQNITPATLSSSNNLTIVSNVNTIAFGSAGVKNATGALMKYEGAPPHGENSGAGRFLFTAGILGAFAAGMRVISNILLVHMPTNKGVKEVLITGFIGMLFLLTADGLILGYMTNNNGYLFYNQEGVTGVQLIYKGASPTIDPKTSLVSGNITDIMFGSATKSDDTGSTMAYATSGIPLSVNSAASGAAFFAASILLFVSVPLRIASSVLIFFVK